MTASESPSMHAAHDEVAPPLPARPRTIQITAIAALAGVLVALAALAYVATPLRTPIQDCGTAATFLLDGRVNVFANPDDPPAGATGADVQANNETPCQERAANRALPGAVVIFAGTLVALGALLVEFFVRLRLSRRTREALLGAQVRPDGAGATPPGQT